MTDQNSASAVDIISEYTNSDESTGNLVLKASYDNEVYVADIYILKGRIYSCSIDKTEPPIGMRLYSSGLIPQDEFSQILRESDEDQNSTHFFQALLAQNAVSDKVINSYIRDEFLASMRIILTWTNIEDYEWKSLEQTMALKVPPLTLEQVYDKVSSNYDALGGIMETIYAHSPGLVNDDDDEIDPETDAENLVPSQANTPDEGDLSVERYNLWKKITGKQNLSQIIENYGQVLTPLLKSVYVLWERGYVSLHLYGVDVETYSPTKRQENEERRAEEAQQSVSHPEGISLNNLTSDEVPTPMLDPETDQGAEDNTTSEDTSPEDDLEHLKEEGDESNDSSEDSHEDYADEEYDFTAGQGDEEGTDSNDALIVNESSEQEEELPVDNYDGAETVLMDVVPENPEDHSEEENDGEEEDTLEVESDENYSHEGNSHEESEDSSKDVEDSEEESDSNEPHHDEAQDSDNEVMATESIADMVSSSREHSRAQEESDKEEASTEPVTGAEDLYEATNDEGGMNSHPVSEQGTVEEMTDDSIISISIKEMSEKSKEFFTRAKELEDYIDNSSSSLEAFEEDKTRLADEKARLQELLAQAESEFSQVEEKIESHISTIEQNKEDVRVLRKNGERVANVYNKIISTFS